MSLDMVKVPPSPAAQLRRDIRRFGVRRTARRWQISAGDALRIAANLVARRTSVERVLERVLEQVRR